MSTRFSLVCRTEKLTLGADIEEPKRVDVTDNLEDEGFECTGERDEAVGVSWACSKDDAVALTQVTVHGESADRIDSVSATVIVYSGSDATAADFLGFLASVPYDGANRAAARAWVQGNIACGSTEMGSARFTLSGPPGGRSLDITALAR